MTATLVAIIGLVMALVLVMRHGALQRLVILAAMAAGNWVRPG